MISDAIPHSVNESLLKGYWLRESGSSLVAKAATQITRNTKKTGRVLSFAVSEFFPNAREETRSDFPFITSQLSR